MNITSPSKETSSEDDFEYMTPGGVEVGDRRNCVIPVVLITIYAAFIVVGILGNLLIVSAVHLRPDMRTARNVFIVTLALSDLVLCIFTMPTTLAQVEPKIIISLLKRAKCTATILNARLKLKTNGWP